MAFAGATSCAGDDRRAENSDGGGAGAGPERRPSVRPAVRGKFLFLGDEKLYVRGVTYGTFRPRAGGDGYPTPSVVERDFSRMAASGVNAIRTYTVPPRWLLDLAQGHGIHVMVGLAWEEHVAFLGERRRARSIEERVRAGVRACAGHPAVLCFAIGNEIPAPIVRWHGHRVVERFLERLYRAAKTEDPDALVTYVNYPSTEYLQLAFADFACFNLYLESEERLDAYLARLHTLVGDRPLVMGELGLDSRRHGEEAQARAVGWQIRTAFAAGCAGAFVFSWTDEWHRGGFDVDDWEFGVTGRDRRAKPALAALRSAFAEVPFAADRPWPRVSVVICSHNGEDTLRDCFEGVRLLNYPDFEVILVDDGSTDGTAAVAGEYGIRTISTGNQGLASARNVGLAAATGEIVAYLDGDAWPDPDWLQYLAATFLHSPHVGVGGPNIPPPGQGPIADCVANAPGGPIHVLLSDREAEHIPGCNMAFWRSVLEAIGGFDPQFRAAGDDVDICWRLQQRGWTLGISPAAVVWHHRRKSLQAYWRQQFGYGKAEALLERKWPERYNAGGQVTWSGRLYGRGVHQTSLRRRWRVYYGTWGSSLFQSLREPGPGVLASLPVMPEWYLVLAVLAGLSALGASWPPLLAAMPLLGVGLAALLFHASLGAAAASFTSAPPPARARLRVLTALLFVLQPLARLCGRIRHGLTPWRRHGLPVMRLPRSRELTVWSERWQAASERLEAIEAALRQESVAVVRGGHYDRWELEVRGGPLSAVRLRMAVEEHGAGRQLMRFRCWPRWTVGGVSMALLLGVPCIGAFFAEHWVAAGVLGLTVAGLALRTLVESSGAMALLRRVLEQPTGGPPPAMPWRGRSGSGARARRSTSGCCATCAEPGLPGSPSPAASNGHDAELVVRGESAGSAPAGR